LNPALGGREKSAGAMDAAGFVLAGGQSSRMGRGKALISFAGRPLIVHALDTLRAAGLTAFVAGSSTELSSGRLDSLPPVVADSEPGLGPLSGICAALSSTRHRWAVFLPVDLPLLPASLIAYLLRHAEITGQAITVASVSGFTQTFPAVLDCAALPALQSELSAGHLGCFKAFKAAAESLGRRVSVVPVELLAQAGHVAHPSGLPACRWFLNVNSPRDLEHAESLSGQPARPPLPARQLHSVP